MRNKLSFEGIELEARTRPATTSVRSETPFRIAFLGDFSGRESSPSGVDVADLKRRRPIEVDRDNIDQVLASFDVRLRFVSSLDQDNETISISLSELDDFEPDRLYEKLPSVARLVNLRERLFDPDEFEQAAEKVRGLCGFGVETERPSACESTPPAVDDPASEVPQAESDGSLLEQSLAATERSVAALHPTQLPSQLEEAIRRAIDPIRVPKVGAQQQELVACVDTMLGNVMRSALQHPRFRALESAWRGLRFLVRRLTTGPCLKIYLIDIGKTELAADLHSADDLKSSGMYKLLVEQSVGTTDGEPWALLAGNYTFEATADDLELAGRCAELAACAGAPFVSAASPRLAGCESLAAAPDPDEWRTKLPANVNQIWAQVRAAPYASCLGLVLPRFLLRYPYGANSRPIDSFDFEEILNPSEHELYAWGNPAFAVAYLLGETFNRSGWRMRPGTERDIDDMPLFVDESDGESVLKSPAETLLTDRAIERLSAAGLMPLAWIKNTDAIRVVRWNSVANTPKGLSGRWS